MDPIKIVCFVAFLIMYSITCYIQYKNDKEGILWFPNAIVPAFMAWIFYQILS